MQFITNKHFDLGHSELDVRIYENGNVFFGVASKDKDFNNDPLHECGGTLSYYNRVDLVKLLLPDDMDLVYLEYM